MINRTILTGMATESLDLFLRPSAPLIEAVEKGNHCVVESPV